MRTTKGSLGKALLGRQAIKKTNGGECAEAWAGRAVGVEPSKKAPVQFTPAVRPRTGENVDTCQGCIFDWSKDKFPFLR